MNDTTNMVTSPLSDALYSIDWAVRFDEFRQYDQSSYSDIHQLITKIESLVENEISNDAGDLNDTKVLSNLFNKAQSGSKQWHCLSMLIHIKIIQAAIPKGLTATATLSAIHIMESMWKIVEYQDKTSARTSEPVNIKATAPRKKPAVKPVQNSPARKKPNAVEAPAASSKPARKPTPKPVAKPASKKSNKAEAKTENVVIKKLAAEAGLEDDEVIAAKCYEIASSLADEYPEYTLTAIRVMTAEKLGVTRQFVENLDIKPARFKSG